MKKKIVICCDGTANQFGKKNTNVVKLYSLLNKGTQKTFYDPGVGTSAGINVYSKISRSYFWLLGLGFGLGLNTNVQQAYKFLMDHYEEGDDVFLFGFSRGAYTVRVLAGMVYMCGLLDKGNESHIPYAYSLYTRKKIDFDLLRHFKKTFSTRDIDFHFMGLWDSVSSVGTIRDMRNYPYTSTIHNVRIVKHAIAIDEKRAYYKNNSITSTSKSTVEEVWFAGVHSDIGGSFPENENGLGKITLKWMIDAAILEGLEIDHEKYQKIIKEKENYSGCNHKDPIHKNAWWWGIFELFPRKKKTYFDGKEKVRWYLPLWRRKRIPRGAQIHESVLKRKEEMGYNPSNLKNRN
jgi:uncharacterized protein (DUF2235 family)